MDSQTQSLLREYWNEQRKKNDTLPEFERLTDSYKLRVAMDIEFKTFRHMKETRKQPMQLHSIETSESEALCWRNDFECKWQGQSPKPTKETLWQQIAAFEEVIQVLRREQVKLQNELETL